MRTSPPVTGCGPSSPDSDEPESLCAAGIQFPGFHRSRTYAVSLPQPYLHPRSAPAHSVTSVKPIPTHTGEPILPGAALPVFPAGSSDTRGRDLFRRTDSAQTLHKTIYSIQASIQRTALFTSAHFSDAESPENESVLLSNRIFISLYRAVRSMSVGYINLLILFLFRIFLLYFI